MREHLGGKLDGYLDKTLDAAGRREVEDHLRSCAACGREMEAARALAARVEEARPPAPPRPAFGRYWDRLLGRHGEVKTMTATQRLRRIAASNVHAAIDSMESPSKMIRQLLREMRDALASGRDDLAEAMAHEARLARRAEAAEAEAAGWDDKAALGLRNGREDLAREALLEKMSRASLAADLREEAARQKARVARLREAYARLSRQFDELDRRKAVWLSRAEAAAGSGTPGSAYREAYAELERIVGDMEGRGDKEATLAAVEGESTAAEELEGMSRAEALEGELAGLKLRLQKLRD